MKNSSVWISAMRLRTLPLSIAGIIAASGIAYNNGIFRLDICLLALLTTVSFQILSNLANDYGDGVKGTDNADRIGPERAIQSGAISPKAMLNAIVVNAFIAIVLAFSLIFISFGIKQVLLISVFALLAIASIIAAMKYTMGQTAYGYRGLGDLFVFGFFGLLSVLGCYMLYAKTLYWELLLPATAIGALSTAVLNLNNMRDRIPDAAAGKLTLAVKLGEKKVKLYHNTLLIIAIITSLCFGISFYKTPFHLVFVLAYIPLLKHLNVVRKNKKPQALDPELKKIALTTFLYAILLVLGFILADVIL